MYRILIKFSIRIYVCSAAVQDCCLNLYASNADHFLLQECLKKYDAAL